MTPVADLVARVLDTVQNPDLSEENVVTKLNEGLGYLCTVLLLPGLLTSEQVTFVPENDVIFLPDNYHRGLFRVVDVARNQADLKVLTTLEQMKECFPGSYVGNPLAVCVAGNRLQYMPMPITNYPVKIHYYRVPDTITLDQVDDIDGFTKRDRMVGIEALYHYCSWKLFDPIEDGMEGQKVNTLYHRSELETRMATLETLLSGERCLKAPSLVRGCFL